MVDAYPGGWISECVSTIVASPRAARSANATNGASVFVGYVLAMVLAHAPIILPAVARVDVPFHRVLWVGPLALHVGLGARLAGDAVDDVTLRRAGSLANALALVAFAASVLVARALAKRVPTG